MTHYRQEINRIRSTCYSNEAQLQTVIGTRHYINSNLGEALNLTLLSRTRFTSKFHLLRLFKNYYGQTPHQYLTDKRIEQSKLLLKNGLSVTESCFAVGFESPASFCTLFKRSVGLTPVNFQKKSNFGKV